MSTESLKMFKKPSNYRINSGNERYFSDLHAEYNNVTTYSQKIMLNERQSWKAQRISFDMHNLRNSQTFVMEKPTTKEKKHKQPKSPGGKLASFLNSLFNQTSSKKNKSSKSSKSLKDDEECPDGRRRRRSSMSHIWTTRSNIDNNNYGTKPSIYPSSISGFRTPPPYSYTTKIAHQEPHGYINHKKYLSLNKVDEKKQGISERKENDWLINGYSEKLKSLSSKFPEKSKNTWADQKIPLEKKEFKKFNIDDGEDSDSSSDLFELKNYHLDSYSCSGLPVYETTNMDGIKKGAPVYSGIPR